MNAAERAEVDAREAAEEAERRAEGLAPAHGLPSPRHGHSSRPSESTPPPAAPAAEQTTNLTPEVYRFQLGPQVPIPSVS